MNYITTAPDRKTLVKAIAEHFKITIRGCKILC